MRSLLLLLFVFAPANQLLAETMDDVRGSFTISLTEYETRRAVGQDVPSAEVLKSLLESAKSDDVSELHTFRLSATAGSEAMAQFGRRVTVTVGKTISPRGEARQTQSMEVGTMLRVSGQMDGDQCTVAIAYEASRLDGEGTEDSPPDVISLRLSGTYVATIGEPLLLGGTNADRTHFLVLTVER